MKAYSLDLRERIVAASDEGASELEVAKRFQVSLTSVQRYKRRRRQEGTLTPTPQKGRVPKIKQEESTQFRTLVESKKDWTLDSLGDAWQELKGFKPSVSVLSDTCQRFKITFKKSRESPLSETKRNEKPSGKK